MNCRRINELMPLIVEGDLPDTARQEAASHLNDCEGCAMLLQEYAASQNWLHTQALPEFDEAFYRDLQRNVMQEITRKSSRPSFFHQLTEGWQRRWAMATLILMLVGAIAFFIYSNQAKHNDPQKQLAETPQQEERKETPSLPNEEKQNPLPKFQMVKHQRKPVQRRRERHLKLNLPVVKPELPHLKELVAGNPFTDGDEKNPINTGEIEDFFAALQMTRMELQTADPNIRIIWFAPKSASPQTSKTDTE